MKQHQYSWSGYSHQWCDSSAASFYSKTSGWDLDSLWDDCRMEGEHWDEEHNWRCHTSDQPEAMDTDTSDAQWNYKENVWHEFDYTRDMITLHCHLRQPTGIGERGAHLSFAKQQYPLLLFLHSSSYTPIADLFPEGDTWPDSYNLDHCFVLCPVCPTDYYWLVRGNSWEEKGGEWIIDKRGFCFWKAPAADEMAHALVGLLAEVTRRYPIDPARISLSGCSMGGHACLDLAARHPNLFCAVAPVAAHVEAGNVPWIVEKLAGVPVWAFHGNNDFCCPIEDIYSLVRQLGTSAHLTTYNDKHHELSIHNSASHVAYVTYGYSLLDWMMRQPPRKLAVE